MVFRAFGESQWLALCPLRRHPATVMQTNAVRALTGRLAAILRRSGGIGPRRHGACFGAATNMPLAPLRDRGLVGSTMDLSRFSLCGIDFLREWRSGLGPERGYSSANG